MGLLFEGLKVIDCGSFIAAPAAATILSDFGADVIKIEPPGAGDPYRHLTKLPGHPKSDQNYAWMLGSRNKRSLAVDMGKPEGRTAIQRLASQADVFITNYPATVRKKLGIGYEALSALNDRLIYASFSGYGENGAEATKPGFDVTAWWARSGLMDAVRASSESVPVRPANGMGDHSAGFTLFSGIVMALYQRQNTGKGTEVTSSLVANGIWANGYNAQAALCGATFTDRPAREVAFNALTNYYQCRDGLWLILTILNEEKQWPELAQCLDRADLIEDVRFAKKGDRLTRSRELIALLDKEFQKRDRAEWRKRLTERGIVFDVVATPADIPTDQQLFDNDILIPFEGSDTLTINTPIALRGSDKVRPKMPPSVGQHSDEVLKEAGFDAAAVAQMRAAGAIG
jgi:crotonobetainyl-CoA:carnitine CoA-transferase CaiB-like acyl-CoA transferase